MESSQRGSYLQATLSSIKDEVLRKRFYIFLCGIALNIVAGTQYGFSLYSSAMRDKFGWTQGEVSNVGIAGNLGLYIGFFIGFFYDRTSPRLTSLLSAALAGTGLFLTYLALLGTLPHPWILVCFFYFFIGQGCWGLYEVGVLTNIKNYSTSPNLGLVTGILVSAFGIASAIYSGIYALFGAENVQNFVLFMFIIIVSASIAGAFIVSYTTPPAEPLSSDDPFLADPMADSSIATELAKKLTKIDSNEATGIHLLKRLDFYLLWVLFAIGAGAGLMVINQLGEVVFSLDGDESLKNVMVAVFSIANCVGRIGSGFVSDKFESRINRTIWTVIVLGITCIAHAIFGVYQDKAVLLPVVLASGLGYGGLFALIPVLIGKYWGLKGVGVNFGFIALAAAVGSFLMNQFAGLEYDRKTNYVNDKGDDRCRNNDCFVWSFRLSAALCLVGMVIGITLSYLKIRQARLALEESQRLLS